GPGAPSLAVGSPLFPRAVVTLAGGSQLVVEGSGAGTANPYVQGLRVNGADSTKTWVPTTPIVGDGHPRTTTLSFDLGPQPNTSWGAAAADAPPSFDEGEAKAIGFLSKAQSDVAPGGDDTVRLGA